MPIGKIVATLQKFVSHTPERAADTLRSQVVPQVNRLEDAARSLSDDALGARTGELHRRLRASDRTVGTSLDDLLPEAFAVVREAARRALGQRIYDVQIIGGAVLHQGKIAEIQPGEDKTLVATLPAYLNALAGDGVHVVTINDYLARRDAVWTGPIYHLLGLSVGCLQHDAAFLYDPEHADPGRGGHQYLTPVSRAEAYHADVLYGAGSEFGFDYLRDNMSVDADLQVQTRAADRPAHLCAIVDEVDNILIDEARTPLIISDPTQQPVEAKQRGKTQCESVTYATITLQNYFRMYSKLAGMTGTAVTEADEFYTIYGLEVVAVPANLPMVRDDANDLIFPTAEGKWRAVVENIVERSQSGQPVLVGTTSIEASDSLSDRLRRRGVQHQVLNARNHEQEDSIVAQAGRAGAVTVFANMSGRGADIILGGADTDRENWQEEHNRVVALGGLHVIGTERHEARRLDNQLRDRAGRQGDPGSSQFFVSLEDELMQRFGGVLIESVMNGTGLNDDKPLESKNIAKAISDAQLKAEQHHSDMRKYLLSLDDVLNQQRTVIYEQRFRVLTGQGLRERVLDMLHSEFDRLTGTHLRSRNADDWDSEGFLAGLLQICPPPPDMDTQEKLRRLHREQIEDILDEYAETMYQAKERSMGHVNMEILVRLLMLKSIDLHWALHLTDIEDLRTGMGLQAMGQQDALTAYRSEGQHAFADLEQQIQREVTRTLFHVTLDPEAPALG